MGGARSTSERTRVRRAPVTQDHDGAARDALLAAALTGVVAVADDGQPYTLPVAVEVSAADPDDDPADLDLPVWAGVVPLRHVWGEPRPAPDLRRAMPVPGYVAAWPEGRA